MKIKRQISMIILAALLFFGMTQFLHAQSNVTRRLVWSGGEHALRYTVEVQRSENGTYQNFLRESTAALFLEVSLPPGQYRFRIIPIDILDRPGEATQWRTFNIQDTGTRSASDSYAVISADDNRRNTPPPSDREPKSADARNNWLSIEGGAVGANIRYERMLSPRTSIGVNYFNGFDLFTESYITGVDAMYNFYPFGKTFFIGAGLGPYFAPIYSEYGNTVIDHRPGLALFQEIGWKIDIGRAGGFFIRFGLKTGFILSENIDLDESFHLFAYFYSIGYAWGKKKE
ncbi:MAG: hypothetical protein LBU88_02020 [Treponema sp.]|jgi:hypothetical protein|nr:hypothetical protein [Treponema sp.]